MNFSLAIFLISDEARMIGVEYYNKDKEDYKSSVCSFKALDPNIKIDDYVIVETGSRHGMTVCKVVKVDEEPDYDSSYEYKWVVGVVQKTDFDTIKAQEDEAILAIRKGEKRRRRDELRKTMLGGVNDGLEALPIYTKSEEEEEKKTATE